MEAKQKAQSKAYEYENEYTDDFEEAVRNDFGYDVQLKDIKGKIRSIYNSVWWGTDDYVADPELNAKLVYNGKEYDITYDIETGNISSTVGYEQAEDSVLEALPLDRSKIIYCVAYDSTQEIPSFSTKDGTCGTSVFWHILTTEDISSLTEEDFAGCENILINDNTDFNEAVYYGSNHINIYSCKENRFANLDHFKAHLMEIGTASNYGSHPNVYVHPDYIDIFDYYNLLYTCAIRLDSWVENEETIIGIEVDLVSADNDKEPAKEYRIPIGAWE